MRSIPQPPVVAPVRGGVGGSGSAPVTVIESQGRVLKVSRLGAPARPARGGRRGIVRGYSSASHRRNVTKHERIDFARAGGVVFMTPTFPAECYQGLAWAKGRLRAFMKRLKRMYPDIGATWKVEPHKSGIAHFHLLVMGMPFVRLGVLRELWRQVIGSERLPRVHVKWERNPKKVVRYLCKYVGKCFDNRFLVEGSYLSTGASESSRWWADWATPGRVWGVFWRNSIPWALRSVVRVEAQWARDVVVRLMRRYFERKGWHRSRLPYPLQPGVVSCGFTLWCEEASKILLWAVSEAFARDLEVIPILIEA